MLKLFLDAKTQHSQGEQQKYTKPPGMHTCMYLPDQHSTLPDDLMLQAKVEPNTLFLSMMF